MYADQLGSAQLEEGRFYWSPAGGARHMRSEFQAAIAQLIAEKGLPREVVMETVATALLAAYRKSFGGGENIRIEVDKNGEVRVWAAKRVVAQVAIPNDEIS